MQCWFLCMHRAETESKREIEKHFECGGVYVREVGLHIPSAKAALFKKEADHLVFKDLYPGI